MGVKETMLTEFIRADRQGKLAAVHEQLLDLGLKYTASGQTLLYVTHDAEKLRRPLAALRVRGGVAVFSLPRRYWGRHVSEVCSALSALAPIDLITVDPADPSSQESMRQIRISATTVSVILAFIRGLIWDHASALNPSCQQSSH